MRNSKIYSAIKRVSLSVALVVGSYSVLTVGSIDDAKAQNYNSGSFLSGSNRARNRNSASRRQIQTRPVQRSSRQNRQGLRFRQQQINDRNVLAQRDNELRLRRSLSRRALPTGQTFIPRNDSNSYDTNNGVALGAGLPSSCPSQYNCGYRLYSNGSGPRIITPGAYLNNDLPNYDGVRGPKIITLD